tara:strand:+ start:34413 stop:34712 length:300 start_codon:yes stop_codon:yes gene_type:complete
MCGLVSVSDTNTCYFLVNEGLATLFKGRIPTSWYFIYDTRYGAGFMSGSSQVVHPVQATLPATCCFSDARQPPGSMAYLNLRVQPLNGKTDKRVTSQDE